MGPVSSVQKIQGEKATAGEGCGRNMEGAGGGGGCGRQTLLLILEFLCLVENKLPSKIRCISPSAETQEGKWPRDISAVTGPPSARTQMYR